MFNRAEEIGNKTAAVECIPKGDWITVYCQWQTSSRIRKLAVVDFKPIGKRKNRKSSDVWDHFTIIGDPKDENVRCTCNYCGRDYACGARKCGTSTLRNHLVLYCKKYSGRIEDKRQKSPTECGGNNLIVFGFNKEECTLMCAKMIVIDELSFSFVEGKGFREFCRVACPNFDPPSRRTVARDIYQLYLDQKLQLRKVLRSQRVSLTTDTWSSIQNINYMSLTAHFVDSDWKLHKRILNFTVIANHKGETIGKAIETCLRLWGIEKVFTITVDNATANETTISYLKRKMIGRSSNGCVLDGKYLHVRCCAHIVNLIVCGGLKEAHTSIVNIRNAVKYVKSSPAREQKFKECVSQEKIDCKSHVFLDVSTRWNSTYLMLEAALKFQKAFERLEEDDVQYFNYFQEYDGGRKRGGPPSTFDWENASVFVKFLKGFFEVTLKFSTSLCVSSNIYLHEVCSLLTELEEWSENGDYLLSDMAINMKKKFDKYWGKMENVNQLLLIATVLDPRYKLEYADFCFGDIYEDKEVACNMSNILKDNTMSIYNWYVNCEASSESNEVSSEANSSSGVFSTKESPTSSTSLTRVSRFMKKRAAKDLVELKNDVDRYLSDACENIEDKDFDVLKWWRFNGNKYGTLSKLARDVMAIQVSTVASESAFSTGGRILDPFRSSLTLRMVEVLVCTQNWLKETPITERYYMEDVEEYTKLDKELSEIECETSST